MRGWLISCLMVAGLAGDSAADFVREIWVVENTKTTEDTVRYLADIDEGDDWSPDIEEQVRLELISSGLFKAVDVLSEPHPLGGVTVTILAQDKHSWVVAPTYYNQPTNKGFGLGFGENNLFGLNKKLLLYGQYTTGDSFFVGGYRDPSLFGLPLKLQLDVFLRRERIFEYAPESRHIVRGSERGRPLAVRQSKIKYAHGGVTLGAQLFRSLAIESRFRAGRVSYTTPELGAGATETDVSEDLSDGCLAREECSLPKPGRAGSDVTLGGSVEFRRLANYYGVVEGARLSVGYESTLASLGSDFDYWIARLNAFWAHRFFSSANLILRTGAAVGEDLPFHAELTSGGTELRGYKNREFRGDLRLESTVEYSFELFNIKGLGLRPLLFWDTAYTRFLNTEDASAEGVRNYLPGHEVRGLAALRNAVGLGARLHIRQIVLPLLGLDVGYGLESGGIEVYFAIGLTDV